MRVTTIINQRKALEAIRVNFGRIEPALKSVCLGRTQFYHWRKTDEAFEAAYLQALDEIGKTTATKLLRKIADNDPKTLVRVMKKTLQHKGVKII